MMRAGSQEAPVCCTGAASAQSAAAAEVQPPPLPSFAPPPPTGVPERQGVRLSLFLWKLALPQSVISLTQVGAGEERGPLELHTRWELGVSAPLFPWGRMVSGLGGGHSGHRFTFPVPPGEDRSSLPFG